MVYRIAVIAILALIGGCDRTDPGTTATTTGTSTGTTATGTTATGTTATGTTATGTTASGCPAPDLGPWDGGFPHPMYTAGVGTTTSPYTNDAGVGALRTATIGQQDPFAVDLPIQDANVTAVGYLPEGATEVTFWFEDAGGVMQGYFIEAGAAAGDLKPGDTVSFTATEVEDYFGTLEVTAATGFTITSTGNDVHVVDGTSGVDYAATPHNVVETYGELTANNGDCGGSECWDMDVNGQTVIFRTGTDFAFLGDCIHWIGPLGEFGGVEQLNANNYDWYRFY